MNNKEESNYFIPILSAIAGLGAILTSISPLFTTNNYISALFIDKNAIIFASIISLSSVIISIWYTSSVQSYEFTNDKPQFKIKTIALFSFLSIFFYSLKVIVDSGLMSNVLGSILQVFIYVFSFIILGICVGVLLRDSIQGFRYQKIEQTKIDRVREALIKSGVVRIDLFITSLNSHQYINGEPLDWVTAHDLYFKTDKLAYRAILSTDYSQLLACFPQQPVSEKPNIIKK